MNLKKILAGFLSSILLAAPTLSFADRTPVFPTSGFTNFTNNVGIATTTPWGMLSINATGSGAITNLFVIASTTTGSPTVVLFRLLNTGQIYSGLGAFGATVNAQATFSNADPGSALTLGTSHRIGVFGQAMGSGALDGRGVYGYGMSSSTANAMGVYGIAKVSATSDVGKANAVFGTATDAHASSSNIGVYGTASGGSPSFAVEADGPLHSSWHNYNCEPGAQSNTIVTTSANNFCGGFELELTGSGASRVIDCDGSILAGYQLSQGNAGANCGVAPTNSGAALVLNTAKLRSAQLPQMDILVKTIYNEAATSSVFRFGFTNTKTVTVPTVGCFVEASTTQANWWFICKTSNSLVTQQDTGVASSSVVTGHSGVYTRFIMTWITSSDVVLKKQTSFAGALTTVGEITTNVPGATDLLAVASAFQISGGLSSGLAVEFLKVSWKPSF